MSVLIVLREHRAESPVDCAKHYRMGDGLDEERGAGRESQEDSRGQEDEENHGDEDVCVKRGHLSVGT